MKKTLITILMIALLAVIGFVIFADDTNSPTNDSPATSTEPTDGDQSDDDISTAPAEWMTYRHARFDFSQPHPAHAQVNTEGPDNRHVKFTVLGPDNATGEITDGFTYTLSTHELDENQTLEAFANEQAQAGGPTDLVMDVHATTTEGKDGFGFTTASLGEIQHLVLEHSNNRAVVVSYNISDPNNVDYEDTVQTMLASMTLEPVSSDEATQGQVSEITLALLDRDVAEGEEPERGCDMVAPITRNIEPTRAPLTAAMEALFSLERTDVQGFYNFIAKTNDTLSFDRARVEDGTAHIYFSGELSGLAGVCDNPRPRIQIEEIALQFATVEDVQLYLNEEPTDLSPTE